MNIAEAPTGINVVVETDQAVFIGRLGRMQGTKVQLHDATVLKVHPSKNSEDFIRETARFGVAVQHKALVFDAQAVRRIRKLGDVPKA